MKEKSQKMSTAYSPQLRLRTKDKEDLIEIVISDNGMGVSKPKLDDFFSSILLGKPFGGAEGLEETTQLSLAITYDILVHVYRGQLKVDAKEGEFTKITITLPKEVL